MRVAQSARRVGVMMSHILVHLNDHDGYVQVDTVATGSLTDRHGGLS